MAMHGAAESAGDLGDDGESESGAGDALGAGDGGAIEGFENGGLFGGWDALAAVIDGDFDLVVARGRLNEDGGAGGGVFEGVADEVVEGLSEERGRGEEGEFAGGIEVEVGEAGVMAPVFEIVGEPGGEGEGFEFGKGGCSFGTGEEEESFNDLLEFGGLVAECIEEQSVFLGGAGTAEGDIDLATEDREGSFELVRGIAGEALLGFEGGLESGEESVEGFGHGGEFIAMGRDRESAGEIGGGHGVSLGGHLSDGLQGAGAVGASEDCGENPEAEGESEGEKGELEEVGAKSIRVASDADGDLFEFVEVAFGRGLGRGGGEVGLEDAPVSALEG